MVDFIVKNNTETWLYLLVSPEHMRNRDILTFWRKKDCGYTNKIDEAERYTAEDLKKEGYKMHTVFDPNKHTKFDMFKLEDFFISERDLHIFADIVRVAYRK